MGTSDVQGAVENFLFWAGLWCFKSGCSLLLLWPECCSGMQPSEVYLRSRAFSVLLYPGWWCVMAKEPETVHPLHLSSTDADRAALLAAQSDTQYLSANHGYFRKTSTICVTSRRHDLSLMAELWEMAVHCSRQHISICRCETAACV